MTEMAAYVHLVVSGKWKTALLVLTLLANAYGMKEMEGFWSDTFWTKDPAEDTTMNVKTQDETSMPFTTESATVVCSSMPMTQDTTVDVTTEEETKMPFTTLTQSETKNAITTVHIFGTQPADASVLIGEDHALTCSIRNPKLTVRWLKDGSPVEYNNRVLKLTDKIIVHSVVDSDAGVYTCIASDIRGNQVASISAQVTVLQHGLNGEECGTVTSPEVLNGTEEIASSIGSKVGRENAVKGSAPWMARLYVRGRGHICGGSLIDRQWVVTAAHCFHQTDPPAKKDLFIRLGDHDVIDKETSEMLMRVEEIYEHEKFDPVTYDNDIALVKLGNPITAYNNYIRPICVTNRVKGRRLMTVGTIGRVNGWGRVIELGLAPQFLTKANIPLVSFLTCKRHFRQSLTTFTRNMFCAGHLHGGADACQGDSGGPYSVKGKRGKWYLTGIVSWGEGCGQPGEYGVYTRYSKYHDWIKKKMNMSRMNTLNSNRRK